MRGSESSVSRLSAGALGFAAASLLLTSSTGSTYAVPHPTESAPTTIEHTPTTTASLPPLPVTSCDGLEFVTDNSQDLLDPSTSHFDFTILATASLARIEGATIDFGDNEQDVIKSSLPAIQDIHGYQRAAHKRKVFTAIATIVFDVDGEETFVSSRSCRQMIIVEPR